MHDTRHSRLTPTTLALALAVAAVLSLFPLSTFADTGTGTSASLSCASGIVLEGMTVDFDAGPRLNYWVVGNGQKIQYSGTARPDETLKLTADTAERLEGMLTIDDGAAGGAKVNVSFDATLSNQYSK